MSKFTTFGSILLLFLLLSGIVFFGFFVFTPKIKSYRALSIEEQRSAAGLAELECSFDKHYKVLQGFQERDKHVDIALNRHFDLERFRADYAGYFSELELRTEERERIENMQLDRLEVNAKIDSPVAFYRFIEALNRFTWVAEIEDPLTFNGKEDGIYTHFTLRVYTLAP